MPVHSVLSGLLRPAQVVGCGWLTALFGVCMFVVVTAFTSKDDARNGLLGTWLHQLLS